MGIGKPILRIILVTALAVYAADCVGMSVTLRAVQCCKSMPCHSKASPEKCCNVKRATNSPFVQANSGLDFAHANIAILPAFDEALLTAGVFDADHPNDHAPPILHIETATPLRI